MVRFREATLRVRARSIPVRRTATRVGTWKLIEARAYDDAGHELPLPFGPHPMGIAVFEAERMIVVVAD